MQQSEIADLKRKVPLSHVVAALGGVKLSRAGGGELVGRCPFHDERSGSFYVNDAKGFFKCHGCGAGGDVVQFIMQHQRIGFRDACDLLRGELPHLPSQPKPPLSRLGDNQENALRIWRNAQELGSCSGSWIDVGTYLRRRGIQELGLCGDKLPIRVADLKHPERGSIIYPALVALIVDVNGNPVAIQRTYLENATGPEGCKLSNVSSAKLALGPVRGNAIRIGGVGSHVIVCEGLEDGLSLRLWNPDLPVWVACGQGNLPHMQFPPEVRHVTIGADNDTTGREGAEKAAQAFRDRGLEVEIIYPLEGFKDFNDELKAAGWA